MDATILFGHSMSQTLPYDEVEMWQGHADLYMDKLQEMFNTPDDGDFGYFSEVDLRYQGNVKEKTKIFPFHPENRIIPKDKYNDYMKEVKPKKYTKSKKLICDWTDKKKYLIHYRMLNFYVTHGMVVEKLHEFIPFKQTKWLEKDIGFNTQGKQS